MKKALIVVDVQPDFCEGGSLPVEGGNAVADEIGKALDIQFNRADNDPKAYDYVVTTQDWHQPESDNGGHTAAEPDYKDTWPEHCTASTTGAELHPAIDGHPVIDAQFKKGFGEPAYSGFQGTYSGITLEAWLRMRDVSQVDVVGIATDYCVKATALDAIKLGFATEVLWDLTAAVGGDEAVKATQEEVEAALLRGRR